MKSGRCVDGSKDRVEIYRIFQEQTELSEDQINLDILDECAQSLLSKRDKQRIFVQKHRIWRRLKPAISKMERPKCKKKGLRLAIALCVVLSLASVGFASGILLWKVDVSWDNETLLLKMDSIQVSEDSGNEFSNSPSGLSGELSQILQKEGISVHLPRWIPERYVYDGVEVTGPEDSKLIAALFLSPEGTLTIGIDQLVIKSGSELSVSMYVEKDENQVEILQMDGITYYLYSDRDYLGAVWLEGEYVIDFSGYRLTPQERLRMLKSIEEEIS